MPKLSYFEDSGVVAPTSYFQQPGAEGGARTRVIERGEGGHLKELHGIVILTRGHRKHGGEGRGHKRRSWPSAKTH